jgi:PAS domain S-box-containing protein
MEKETRKTKKQLLAELAEARTQITALEGLHVLIKNLPDHIYVKDKEGRFLLVNTAQAHYMGGVKPDELVGKSDFDFYPAELASRYHADEQAIIRSGQPLIDHEEINLNHQTGEQTWTSTTKIPVRDDQGQVVGIVGISRDITQRKWAEAELARQAQELARSNVELEQFAYVASHDLQEPLRMVRSYLQLLERRYKSKLDADADEFIAYAVDGAARMQTLINDLLAYSRIGTQGKPPQPTNCAEVLERVLANLAIAIEESEAVVMYDALPTILADGVQLGQLFQNLIGNAIKFRGKATPKVHVGAERKDGEWHFWVRDNGIGIAPEYYHRLFMIFQRLHSRNEYPGTGIGLAICKKIVERHGGRIWVESLGVPGKGTTFYFSLPDRDDLK